MLFSDWLLSELAKRKWSQADLARNSGLTKQAITNYVSGRMPNRDAVGDFAKGFKLPPEIVFRAVEGKTELTDPWIEEMNHKIKLLGDNQRPYFEKILNSLIEDAEPLPSKKPKRA
jgi:transcriptional regulator with XRE-family HTH domain